MSYIWAAIAALSLVFSVINGHGAELSASVLSGAAAAVELALSMCGAVCLWSGICCVMSRCGMMEALSRFLGPVLRFLYPQAYQNEEIRQSLSANMTANLLGLGNAATPAGIRAATLMKSPNSDAAGVELCLLIVTNTASIQLIPSTVAAIRAAEGSQSAFDILPAVWVCSLLSVSAGVASAKLAGKLSGKHSHD